MSYRGTNPNSNTPQVWDGTKWISIQNVEVSDSGANALISNTNGSLSLNAVLGNASLVATAGDLTTSGKTGASMSTDTGAASVNSANGNVSLAAGTDVTISSTGKTDVVAQTSILVNSIAGALVLVSTNSTAGLEGNMGVDVTSSAGGASLAGNTGASVSANTGDVNVTSSAGNLNLIANSGVTTINGDQILLNAQTQEVGINSNTNIFLNAPNTVVSGNLIVNGTTTSVDTTNVLIADNYININQGNVVDGVPRPGGLVVDLTPSQTTALTTGFSTGPFSVSAPGLALAAGDFIQITGANNVENNGLFQVFTYVDPLITIDTAGEDFVQTAFTEDATVTGTVSAIVVSVARAGTTGAWEQGTGSTAPISYSSISPVVSMQAAYDGGPDITGTASMTWGLGAGVFTLDATAITLNPDGNLSSTSGGAAGSVNFADYLNYTFAPTAGSGNNFSADIFASHNLRGNNTAVGSFNASQHFGFDVSGPSAAANSNGIFSATNYANYNLGTNHVAGSSYQFNAANAFSLLALNNSASFTATGFGNVSLGGGGAGLTSISAGSGGMLLSAPSGLVTINGNSGLDVNTAGPITMDSTGAGISLTGSGSVNLTSAANVNLESTASNIDIKANSVLILGTTGEQSGWPTVDAAGVLTSNGAGSLSWVAAAAVVSSVITTAGGLANADTITPITTSSGAVIIDLPNIKISPAATSNIAIGLNTPTVAGLTGTDNTVIGSNALSSADPVSNNNTIVGANNSPGITLASFTTEVGSNNFPLNTAPHSFSTVVGSSNVPTRTTGQFQSNTIVGVNNVSGGVATDVFEDAIIIGTGNAPALGGPVNTDGNKTTILGIGSADVLTTGSFNKIIGSGSAEALTTGDSNVMIGESVGAALVTGSSNILLGDSANVSAAGVTGAVAIGGSATASTSSIAIGGPTSVTGTESIGIGSLSIAGGDQTVALGVSTITAGADSIAIGHTANAGGGIDNTVIGTRAGALTTGTGNIVLGKEAAKALTTGSNNTIIGKNAAPGLSTQASNTIIGSDVGLLATNGDFCVVIGERAMNAATSLGFNTVAIGASALPNLTGGLGNVAIGSQAGANTTTGSDNISIGSQSGGNTTTGGGNILIGAQTNFVGGATGSNSIAIGHQNALLHDGSNNAYFGTGRGPIDSTTAISNYTVLQNMGSGLNGSAAFGLGNNPGVATEALLVAQDASGIPLGAYVTFDNFEALTLDSSQDATNGGTTNFFVGNRTPVGNVVGSPGDMYFREAGVNSAVYQHKGAAANNSDWIEVGGSAGAPSKIVVEQVFADSPISPNAATLEANEITYAITTSGGAFVLNLPTTGSEPTAGTVFRVKDASGNAATNNITIQTAAGTIIDGANQIIGINYGSLSVQSRGPNNGYMLV